MHRIGFIFFIFVLHATSAFASCQKLEEAIPKFKIIFPEISPFKGQRCSVDDWEEYRGILIDTGEKLLLFHQARLVQTQALKILQFRVRASKKCTGDEADILRAIIQKEWQINTVDRKYKVKTLKKRLIRLRREASNNIGKNARKNCRAK